MSVDYRIIGQRIKIKRKSIRKTQDHVAEALSVSVGYISQIERGVTKVNLDTLSKLCGYLGCDLAELVCGSCPNQMGYLERELQEACSKLGPRQKQLLVEMAKVLAQSQ